jgi:hypothetical protein
MALARGLAVRGRGSEVTGEGLAVGSGCTARCSERDKNAPPDHKRDFDLAEVSAFRRVVERIKPGATGPDTAALLAGKARRQEAVHWLSGRRAPPQWAIDLLRRRWEAIDAETREALAQIKTGPGKRAGAINIKRWRARR